MNSAEPSRDAAVPEALLPSLSQSGRGAAAEVEPLSERASFYRERARGYAQRAEREGQRSARVSNLRGLTFAVALICGLWAFFGQPPTAVTWVALAGLVVFPILVWKHATVLKAEDSALRWVAVNQAGQARCSSAWKEQQSDGFSFINPVHPYSGDLDLFGPRSLFQRMNVARTQFGQQRLAALLMNRAGAEEVLLRQQAAQELEPLLEFRQEFEALALGAVEPASPREPTKRKKSQVLDPEPLLSWAESKPSFSGNIPLIVVAWVGPVLCTTLMVVCFMMSWHPLIWITALIAQAIVLLTARQVVSSVFAAVSAGQGQFLRFGPMLELLERLEAQSTRLKELKRRVHASGDIPPSVGMRQFESAVGWFELRHNGLVYPFINGLLLWDIHCVLRLERWQQRFGKELRGWFKALGELEALSSLAAFKADNPEFTWPQVSTGSAHFEAEALGHPLLGQSERVCNDVSLSGPGRGLLVTGSNMSGKSTLLRSIGVNISLAMAGAPVCAKKLALSPLALRTSMRISDSLDDGVSHFYAEVRKLKSVLDALDGDAPVLFLLDEVLHGTNSRERQIGARWVLGELLRQGALGAVSTHDSGLCELPQPLMDQVEQVHLREDVEGDEMSFDYKLRPGPVRSGNALRLMRFSGIEVPLQEDGV